MYLLSTKSNPISDLVIVWDSINVNELGVKEAVEENVKEATETVGKKLNQAKRSAQGKISFGIIVSIFYNIRSNPIADLAAYLGFYFINILDMKESVKETVKENVREAAQTVGEKANQAKRTAAGNRSIYLSESIHIYEHLLATWLIFQFNRNERNCRRNSKRERPGSSPQTQESQTIISRY